MRKEEEMPNNATNRDLYNLSFFSGQGGDLRPHSDSANTHPVTMFNNNEKII